jgi:hypothetical protein
MRSRSHPPSNQRPRDGPPALLRPTGRCAVRPVMHFFRTAGIVRKCPRGLPARPYRALMPLPARAADLRCRNYGGTISARHVELKLGWRGRLEGLPDAGRRGWPQTAFSCIVGPAAQQASATAADTTGRRSPGSSNRPTQHQVRRPRWTGYRVHRQVGRLGRA